MFRLTAPGTVCARLSAVRRLCAIPALALALVFGIAVPASAQDKEVDLRLSLWVPPAHPLTSAAKAWGEDIAKASNGTIKITVFPSEQLGKAFDHYDMARDGIGRIHNESRTFVPATSTLGKRFSGCPSAANKTRMCARSNLCDGVWASSWPSAYICATAVS